MARAEEAHGARYFISSRSVMWSVTMFSVGVSNSTVLSGLQNWLKTRVALRRSASTAKGPHLLEISDSMDEPTSSRKSSSEQMHDCSSSGLVPQSASCVWASMA